MRTKDLLRCELIGLIIEVVDSKNKSLLGLKGQVVDETKHTLVIEVDGKNKRLLKSQITIKCKMKQKLVRIKGSLLAGRPEDRLKK
tara:strand:+ start:29871 stop:30128 length:258 start_codon:yes stop_codon:yes gene_type:complete